jgi:hypothetical protein
MKVAVISGQRIGRRIKNLAVTAALAAGVYLGVQGYNRAVQTHDFANNLSGYSAEFYKTAIDDIPASYALYTDLKGKLLLRVNKDRVDSLYVTNIANVIDNTIEKYASSYSYAPAKEYLSAVEKSSVLQKIGLYEKLSIQWLKIDSFNPERLLQKADSVSIRERIPIYEGIIRANVFPEKQDSLKEKLRDSRYQLAVGGLSMYFSKRSSGNSLDAFTDYTTNMNELSSMYRGLTKEQQRNIYSLINSNWDADTKISDISTILRVTKPLVDISPIVSRIAVSKLESVLKKNTISSSDLTEYSELQDLNSTAQLNMTDRLKRAYIEMIPKADVSEREKMLNTVLTDYSGFVINDNKEPLIKAIKSVQTDDRANQTKYRLMIQGLGGK